MDIGNAFTFMFDDEEWVKKLAIGGGIALVAGLLSPVVIGIVLVFPLLGYMIDVIKNVKNEVEHPLPAWDDFGGFFMKGLMVFLIGLVYSLPMILFGCVFGIIMAVASGADENIVSGIMACFGCIVTIISLVIAFIMPAAIIRYAQYETFGSAFQFGEIFNLIKSNVGNYIIVILLAWVASMLANLGFILCVVGFFFTFFWSLLVTGHLYGQLAKEPASI